jgi:putative ABC transport system permease protein
VTRRLVPQHRVPLGRRVLFGDGRRGLLTVGGVAAALLLALVLQAVVDGALARVTYYPRTSPADVVVSQAGVRTMHMSTSTLPPAVMTLVGEVDGVRWAAPLWFTSGAVGGPRGRLVAYVIGYEPTGRGGPATLVAGRAPGPGEVVVDDLAAEQLGLSLGSTVTVLGASLTISGVTTGSTSITNTTAFVSRDQFALLRALPTSYLLVGGDGSTSPESLAERLRTTLPGVTVQTREQFVASETRLIRDMTADLLRLMNLVGLLVAVAVIALGLLTSVVARVRDYAVLKALGAPTRRLVATVTAQVLWTVTLALVMATVGAFALALVVPRLTPTVTLVLTPGNVVRAGLVAAAAGLLAALLPLKRLARVDPITAFREHR